MEIRARDACLRGGADRAVTAVARPTRGGGPGRLWASCGAGRPGTLSLSMASMGSEQASMTDEGEPEGPPDDDPPIRIDAEERGGSGGSHGGRDD
jgi:hypothetical protein